jgi:hypothetical protein
MLDKGKATFFNKVKKLPDGNRVLITYPYFCATMPSQSIPDE